MNREQRRDLQKKGASKDNIERLDMYQSPCSIIEATQIARGVAEDVVAYHMSNSRNLQVAISLQVEIIKEILFKAGLIKEEEFRELYVNKVNEFNKMQEESVAGNPVMEPKVSEIEVKKD